MTRYWVFKDLFLISSILGGLSFAVVRSEYRNTTICPFSRASWTPLPPYTPASFSTEREDVETYQYRRKRSQAKINYPIRRPSPKRPPSRSPPDWQEYYIASPLRYRVFVHSSCRTQEKVSIVNDALNVLPDVIRAGARQAERVRDEWLSGRDNQERGKGGLLGANVALKEYCPVWDTLFGTKGITIDPAPLNDWVDDWASMKKLFDQIFAGEDLDERVLITCYDSVTTAGREGQNLCQTKSGDKSALAMTFEARDMMGVNQEDQMVVSYQNVNSQIINLCADFFEIPTLTESTRRFEILRKSKGVQKVDLPKFEDIYSGALVLLHELMHLGWTMNARGGADDRATNGISSIRSKARTEGFLFMRGVPDPNAHFGFWAYYAFQVGTKNCVM